MAILRSGFCQDGGCCEHNLGDYVTEPSVRLGGVGRSRSTSSSMLYVRTSVSHGARRLMEFRTISAK
jgi:hypothetical protein